MNAQAPFERLPIEQVPGYQAEVNRRSLEYVQENWYNIEEFWTIEEQKQNRAAFEAKMKAEMEAEYKNGQHLNWGK